jgi:hypothetical protein
VEEGFGVVAFRADGLRQGAAEIGSGVEAVDDEVEIAAGTPAELSASALIDVDTIEGRKHLPVKTTIGAFIVLYACPDNGGCVGAERSEVLGEKRRCGADDVFAEPDGRRERSGEKVGTDDVFEVHAAVEVLVDLEVLVGESGAELLVVVLFGEKARGAEDKAGKAMVSMKELAEVLGSGFGNAIDIFGDGCDVFGDPRGGCARRRDERIAEDAMCWCR